MDTPMGEALIGILQTARRMSKIPLIYRMEFDHILDMGRRNDAHFKVQHINSTDNVKLFIIEVRIKGTESEKL